MLPEAQNSKWFNTYESGFSISAREGIIRYVITLEEEIPRTKPLFLTVQYQNPANEDQPFTEDIPLPPDVSFVHLESPPLSELEQDKIYRIQVQIFEAPERKIQIDEHEIFIFSIIETKRYGR